MKGPRVPAPVKHAERTSVPGEDKEGASPLQPGLPSTIPLALSSWATTPTWRRRTPVAPAPSQMHRPVPTPIPVQHACQDNSAVVIAVRPAFANLDFNRPCARPARLSIPRTPFHLSFAQTAIRSDLEYVDDKSKKDSSVARTTQITRHRRRRPLPARQDHRWPSSRGMSSTSRGSLGTSTTTAGRPS